MNVICLVDRFLLSDANLKKCIFKKVLLSINFIQTLFKESYAPNFPLFPSVVLKVFIIIRQFRERVMK